MADKLSFTFSREKLREKIDLGKEKFRGLFNSKLEILESFFDLSDLSDRDRKILDANIFLGKMLLVGAVFHGILFFYPNTVAVQEAFAGFLTDFMNSVGYSFTHHGIYMMDGASGYEITQDCLGWKSMMAFTALMISSGGIRKNVKYLFAGLGLIVLANFVRVITTVHLAELGIFSFEIIHGFLWRWSLTALVLVMWIIWFEYYR